MSLNSSPEKATDARFFRTPDIAHLDVERDIGCPRQFPFTRGIREDMYQGRPWTMRQYAGFATARASNERYRALLAGGVNGLSVAFDLPTQIGYDSDHPFAAGEVGRVGVAIASVEDMSALFDGVPLDRISTSMTINATAIILFALYVAVARRNGIALSTLSGTAQNDILKEYVARGTYIYPPAASMRLITDMMAFCTAEMPQCNPIPISGYDIREAGSTATQEVANGIAYVRAAVAAGVTAAGLGPRLSFFFNAHNNCLEEVATFRAARRLWARIMRDRFNVTSARGQQLRFHTHTAGSTLAAQQSEHDVVRVTRQALTAVFGGTQSLHTNGRDEASSLPSEGSARLALRTQQVILHESGVSGIVDPLGGSYAIEEATDRIEREAQTLIESIDARGGVLAAIDSGYIQREIQSAAYAAQQAIDAGDTVVGVNRYQSADEPSPEDVFRIDPSIEQKQVERVRAVRAGRSQSECRDALETVVAAAESGSNLVPPIIVAVERLATLGEVADALRRVFGEHRHETRS